MAASAKTTPVGSPQEHIVMCGSHGLPIEMICEECEEFICAKCAKTGHRDHNWNTLHTAATEKRRSLLEFLKKIKKENLLGLDEKIEKTSKQITENKELCESEIKKLQRHFDEIMIRLKEIRKCHENTFRDDLEKKDKQLKHVKSVLEKRRNGIIDAVEYMEKNNSTMSDYKLIDKHRKLTKMLSKMDVLAANCEHSVRFTRGGINDDFLNYVVGKTWNLDNIVVAEKNSFQYGDKLIYDLETFIEDQCHINEHQSKYIEKVNMGGVKIHRFDISSPTFGMCVTDTGEVYFTDFDHKSIKCLSPSGSVSTVIGTDPLEPAGICQSVDGGLLVTLRDDDPNPYKLEPHSRRLVRHITVTGDVIYEYEYQEDGHTRLFTWPEKVTQNSNSDICVVNSSGVTTGHLMIMSPSGRMKSVYRGQNLAKKFGPSDVVCDSLCNILVTDLMNKQIHLLSSDGEFLKFLLSENETKSPYSLSLYMSTLWVGYDDGLVRVFQYRV